jgi:hypothetical protein
LYRHVTKKLTINSYDSKKKCVDNYPFENSYYNEVNVDNVIRINVIRINVIRINVIRINVVAFGNEIDFVNVVTFGNEIDSLFIFLAIYDK